MTKNSTYGGFIAGLTRPEAADTIPVGMDTPKLWIVSDEEANPSLPPTKQGSA